MPFLKFCMTAGTSVYFVYAIWFGSVDKAIARQEKEGEGAETYDREVLSRASSWRNTRQSSVFSPRASAKSIAVSEKLERINAGFDHGSVKIEEVGNNEKEVNGGKNEEVNSGNNEPVSRFEVTASNPLEKY